jgi:phage-related protein
LGTERRIARCGKLFTIAYARDREGNYPGEEFFDQLLPVDKAKLMKLFEILGDLGKCSNDEKFGDLGGGLYEFKSFQIRMPFIYPRHERHLVLISHGFYKKRDKAPPAEIERAWRIFHEDEKTSGLRIVAGKRPKRNS